mmetsp:Transcript_22526/g.50920  ORF Transcript_22526/g.50920 Transcript_22526/m.50920 type:complete len:206 (-) Transcript_22526:835-1452(-)
MVQDVLLPPFVLVRVAHNVRVARKEEAIHLLRHLMLLEVVHAPHTQGAIATIRRHQLHRLCRPGFSCRLNGILTGHHCARKTLRALIVTHLCHLTTRHSSHGSECLRLLRCPVGELAGKQSWLGAFDHPGHRCPLRPPLPLQKTLCIDHGLLSLIFRCFVPDPDPDLRRRCEDERVGSVQQVTHQRTGDNFGDLQLFSATIAHNL